MPRKLRILVSGMVAGVPHQGGATWAVLQYVLGLRSLGHEVYLVESVDANRLLPAASSLEKSTNAFYFQSVVDGFGLADASALLVRGSRDTIGMSPERLARTLPACDVHLNISGLLVEPEWTNRIPIRVYLDLDPGFTQLWHAVERIDMRFAGHTHYVTIGQKIGHADCSIPTCGLDWIPTIQPVVLDQWPVAHELHYDAFTTVGHWRGYGSIEYEGTMYGQRAHSFRQFMELPLLISERLMPALAVHDEEVRDLWQLSRHGWQLLNPALIANNPRAYRDFIRGSKGEVAFAKSGYVNARCGWFSDRSACYLASGRPVIAQDTCFTQFLPTGMGLLSFKDMNDLVAAIEDVTGNYKRHCEQARLIAREYLASEVVLCKLLDRIGAG